MKAAWRHLRLFRRFVVQAAVRETHYRANFLATLAVGFVQLGLGLVPVLLIFSYTDEVRGWSRFETLALVGLYQVVTGLIATVVQPNMWRMQEYIVRGNLDGILLRPVSGQFLTMFRWINLAELGNVATGLGLFSIGLLLADTAPGAGQVVQAVLLLGSGLVLVSCAWAALSYLAFWTQQTSGTNMLVPGIMEAGRYPLAFFPAAARAFLIFAVPMGFATTFPVRALVGGISWWWVALGIGSCVVAVALLRVYWRLAVRSYASASS